MAQISFTGPDPTNPQATATTTVEVPDSMLLQAVQSICVLRGYSPETGLGPGQFAIQQMLGWCSEQIAAYDRQSIFLEVERQIEVDKSQRQQSVKFVE